MTNKLSLSKVGSPRFVAEVSMIALALIVTVAPLVSSAAVLNRQLDIGMSGSDVSALQTYLAQDNTIYPQGLVTGYFGKLTSSAVSNFQSRNGIATAARVGPITLAALNLKMNGSNVGGQASMIGNIGLNIGSNSAVVSWNTDDSAKGVVYYSTSPLTTYENSNSVDVSGNTAMTDGNFRTSQAVMLSGLQAHTTYYYMIYTTNQAGNVSVSWPSTFQTSN